MLFSPGFKLKAPLLWTAPFISHFKDWLRKPDLKDTNYAKYSISPINAYTQYYKTSKNALNELDKNKFTRPIFMVLTEHDSVLDSKYIKKLFKTRFNNSKNKLIWYGYNSARIDNNIRYIDSRNKNLHISNMSHMGILFSPKNPYHGINGSQRICFNKLILNKKELKACQDGAPVWYSAMREWESSNFHARLTFNPDFEIMMNDLYEVFGF